MAEPTWHFPPAKPNVELAHTDFLNEVWKEVWTRQSYAPYRGLMRRAVPFTLDTAATKLVTELATKPEFCPLYRNLARLPYDVVWLEFDYKAKVDQQVALGTRVNPYRFEDEPVAMGYLLERLTETRWRVLTWTQLQATEEGLSRIDDRDTPRIKPGERVIETMPPMFILDTEGKTTGYRTLTRDPAISHAMQELIDVSDAPAAVGWGLTVPEVQDMTDPAGNPIYALSPELSKTATMDLPPDWEALLMRAYPRPHERRNHLVKLMGIIAKEQSGIIRFISAALASLTSTPTVMVSKQRSGHFRASGQMRPYKINNTVSLTIPGRKTMQVKNLIGLFKGAKRRMPRHPVHGFWRTTTATVCPSDRWQWLWSTRHREMRWHIWINDFERGDAALGYVLRKYEVKT